MIVIPMRPRPVKTRGATKTEKRSQNVVVAPVPNSTFVVQLARSVLPCEWLPESGEFTRREW